MGTNKFNEFNDLLIALSESAAADRGRQLAAIGKARNVSITYRGTDRPKLKKVR